MVLGPFRAGVVADSGEKVRFCTVFCCKTAILHSPVGIGALPWVKSPSSLIHSIYDLSR